LDNRIAKSLGALAVSQQVLNLRQKYGADAVKSCLVSDKEAVKAVVRFANENRMLVEPACGAALATVFGEHVQPLKRVVPGLHKESVVVVIVCGGSTVDLDSIEKWKRDLNI
jgi:L-serine/L-threonine ammonia-lyase